MFSASFTAEPVRKAIVSFPNGSAGGPVGLSPQHLKDLTGPSANEGGEILLNSITSLVTLILKGNTPNQIHSYFFGATLVGLANKDGGVRPITIGCTLRRLAAKCASTLALSDLLDLLSPHQLGFGIPQGVEAAVHAAQLYLCSLQSDQVIVKVDFENAFNSVRRDKFLLAVEEFIPALLPFVHSAYCVASSLMWGSEVVESSEDVQQSDPPGPLLFCLAIHKMCAKLMSESKVLYLEDGTLDRGREVVISDVKLIEEEASKLGLRLNRSKPELICSDHTIRGIVLSALPGLHVVNPEDAELLGSPLGDANTVDTCVNDKIKMLELMGDRLRYLHSHDAITLLRHSFAIPNMLDILHTSPCFTSPHLQDYYCLIHQILEKICNINFGGNDTSWLKATLPINMGGLGIRSAVPLAPSAFLASTDMDHSSLSITSSHLDSSEPHTRSRRRHSIIGGLVRKMHCPFHRHLIGRSVGFASAPGKACLLLSSTTDARSRLCLLDASTKELGALLKAQSASSLGLRMDDETIHIAIGLRLRCPLIRMPTVFATRLCPLW